MVGCRTGPIYFSSSDLCFFFYPFIGSTRVSELERLAHTEWRVILSRYYIGAVQEVCSGDKLDLESRKVKLISYDIIHNIVGLLDCI